LNKILILFLREEQYQEQDVKLLPLVVVKMELEAKKWIQEP